MKISPFLFSFQMGPDGEIFPVGHIKGQCAAAQVGSCGQNPM